MTILVVLLLGAGIVLIASSLECIPITTTFQKILASDKIDWSGTANCGSSSSTQQVVPPAPGTQKQPSGCKGDPNKVIALAPPVVIPDKNGCCPDGYSLMSLGLTGGQGNICINNYNIKT